MILADKIIDLRKKNGWSQEELAEKLDVSRQSISKWESAQSVPDMGRILRLSEVFGVTTDYLLRDDAVPAERTAAVTDPDGPARLVSMEEANGFLRQREENAARTALGVLLCILSPVLLIVLGGAYDAGKVALTEMQVGGIGLVVLLLMVCAAVALFILSNIRGERYDYLDKEPIDTLYGVDGMVRERRERFRSTYTLQLTLGVVLCVASSIPMFLAMMLNASDFAMVLSIGAILCVAAVGVLLIVRAAMVWDGFRMLLEEGDYTREAKRDRQRHSSLGTIYWGLVTAGYLAWSFLTNDWHRTWIVWPVAAVAYGAVFAIAGALRRRDG